MKEQNYPRINFRISQENLDFLNEIAQKYNISKSKLMNFLIENYLCEVQNKTTLDSENKQSQQKEVKVFLNEQDYEILKTSAKNNLRSSVQNELKFHALNAISNTKILDYKEAEALLLTRSELNKIGSNINQIARVLNTEKSPNVDEKNLANILDELDLKIQKLTKDIRAIAIKKI